MGSTIMDGRGVARWLSWLAVVVLVALSGAGWGLPLHDVAPAVVELWLSLIHI